MVVLVGMTMLLTNVTIGTYWLIHPITLSGFYFDLRTAVILGFLPFGLILTFSGMIIRRKFSEQNPFLTKDGGPIHSGETWKRSSESGVFLTSCGIVLSINQESNATSHIGYKIVTVERTTCRDCALREGREILESVRYTRDGP
ncbi:MAG: hypothetical protein ACXABX_07910 [Candidatus Thorarchaeota archaeon]